MKARFFAFLGAVAIGSAAVLIYASQSHQHQANASLGDSGDCSSCEMSTTKAASMSASDECCAAEAAKPAVATLATAGCPYVAGDTNATVVAAVPPAKASTGECCAVGAAAATVTAQVEK